MIKRSLIAAIVGVVVLGGLVAIGGESRQIQPLPPIAVDTPHPAERSFAMGFTSWPYDVTDEAVAWTYDAIGDHGELIVFHNDDGVPWSQLAAGEHLPQDLVDDLDAKAAAARRFDLVYVSATPQTTDRRTIAGGWDGADLPDRWRNRPLDDPEVIDAYLAWCRWLIDRFDPDWFAYGIEVNANMRRGDPEYDAFRRLAQVVYPALKAEHPDLPVFLTFQMGSFEIPIDEQMAVTEELMAYSDLMGVSSYPYLAPGLVDVGDGDPRDLPTDWFDAMASIDPSKPVAITETGFIAEPLDLAAYDIAVPGSPEGQAAYVDFLLAAADRLGAEFVVWWQIRDYDDMYDLLVDLGRDDPAFLIWRDIGLFAGDGTPRPALAVWDAWKEAEFR